MPLEICGNTLIRLLVELPERLCVDEQILHLAFVSSFGSFSKNFQTGLTYDELDACTLSKTFKYRISNLKTNLI